MSSSINKYIKGSYNVICDVCDRKRKSYETTMSYGAGDIPVLRTCIDTCSDERHPLNSPPPVIFDGRPVPDARPDVAITFEYTPSGITIGNFYGQRIGHFNPFFYGAIGRFQIS